MQESTLDSCDQKPILMMPTISPVWTLLHIKSAAFSTNLCKLRVGHGLGVVAVSTARLPVSSSNPSEDRTAVLISDGALRHRAVESFTNKHHIEQHNV